MKKEKKETIIIDSQEADNITNIENQTIFENIENNITEIKKTPLYILSSFTLPTIILIVSLWLWLMVDIIIAWYVFYIFYFFIKDHSSEHNNIIIRNIKTLFIFSLIIIIWNWYKITYQELKTQIQWNKTIIQNNWWNTNINNTEKNDTKVDFSQIQERINLLEKEISDIKNIKEDISQIQLQVTENITHIQEANNTLSWLINE